MHEETGEQQSTQSLTIHRSQLEQLQKIASVGAVASSVAHEFNNILTTILNHAKIGMRTSDNAAKERAFEKILLSARRAAKITTGVLALSRNRSERKQALDIIPVVEEVLAVVEKDLTKHQVRLEVDLREHCKAEIVPQQIEQVLMNLIINARQAMPRGGTLKVTVSANQDSGMVEIGIRDTGVGIEPDKLGKIFEPFYTTKDGPDSDGHGGSGLGLSICREIIERHEGRIRVESYVGRGTEFTVKLPIYSSSDSPQNAA